MASPYWAMTSTATSPFVRWCYSRGCNFIFTCKPDSHATLYERLAFWQATDGMAEYEGRRWNGRFTEVTMVRYLNDVLLRSGDDALSVNWFDLTVVNAKTGEQLYHNSCITNHRLTADNVVDVAQASRGRWKIENENNNVLKTKGYHLEHNFGHGKQYLSAFLLSLNLLAFLFHTVLEWSDDKYALLRHVLARRQTFFQDIQALMRYMVFDGWEHLMDFMIRGLELESHVRYQLISKIMDSMRSIVGQWQPPGQRCARSAVTAMSDVRPRAESAMGRYMVMEAYTDALASQSVGFVYSHCSGKACGPGRMPAISVSSPWMCGPLADRRSFASNRRCSLSFCFCWRALSFSRF